MSAASALLVESANYRLVFELRPCDAVSPLIQLCIDSWYLDAKDPSARQRRFQTLATPAALLNLRNAIDAVLAGCGGSCEPMES